MRYPIGIRILKCTNCGKLALALEYEDGGGSRITGHKCAGEWKDKKLFDDVDWAAIVNAVTP